MVPYQYTFLDFADIISYTWSILEQDITGLIFILMSISTTTILFFVILPFTLVTIEKSRKEREKQKKKNLLTEILLKKEIEDEIEKEISIDKSL